MAARSWKTWLRWGLAGTVLATVFWRVDVQKAGRLAEAPGTEVGAGSPVEATLDLGRALVPEDTPPDRVHAYDWRVEGLEPARQQVAYGLGEAVERGLEQAHRDHSLRLRYRAMGPERFTYVAPPGCGTDMRCIYAELMQSNAVPVRVLGERFATSIRERNLDAAQATELILGFVRRIRYELPGDEPFGIVPPGLVPAQDRGDCDSKAVLALMLLRQVGVDAVLLYSDALAHAAIGVGLPGSGTRIPFGGRGYQYAELTADGWPLGMIPPQYNKPQLWRVLPLPDAPTPAPG
ncbi:hypothetical protein G4177_15830 [Corallococcus sp. ZKHCc1 1396]|uniref:Transglutaminase domain-containing protein n=1 Tax=Corallococcus soli TaxID=2710757 RepID=A0ABR9PNY5_9BACT|nr:MULTISPECIES: hypothetical protein [Corallococcus]MBE4749633.1 hypothetical protein [Corallococcus soli]MCY1035082.1 hypothetical protein [Corallococcus sp. BB11-1]